MQLHTFMIAGNSSRLQFCVFTGSGSPTDEWHHETDSRGDKVVRVEFEISRFASSTEFNEAIKAAEQKATEEYHKHCALRGPMEVKANIHALGDYLDFVRSTESAAKGQPPGQVYQGAFTDKEGVTVPLNNAEVKVALGQYVPTAAENEAAEDFFKRHGVLPYIKNSAELDKAVSKIVAAFPRAFGIVKQPLTPEQKADMDKYYEILSRQAKDAVGVILSVDNLSQLGLSKGPENATDAKQRLDAAKKSWDANISGKLIPVDQQYGLLNTFLSEAEKAGITHLPIDQQKLPTSDPVALDAMIEKRTEMAEALRKQGVEFIGYEIDGDGMKRAKFKPIDNANIEALKQRVRVAKRSWEAALAKPVKDGN